MTDAVPATKNSATEIGPNADPYAAYAEAHAVPTGTPFMSFNGQTGIYSWGADREVLEEGHRLVIAMSELYRGFQKWLPSSDYPDEKVTVRIESGDPFIQREDLGDTDPTKWPKNPKRGGEKTDPWSAYIEVLFKDPESGDQMIFNTSTISQINAFDRLFQQWVQEYRMHDGQLAVIELGKSEFKGATGDMVPTPKFEIVEWIDEQDLVADDDKKTEF